MKRRNSNQEKPNTGSWLTTYADMMNNLLVMFILLYMMSVIDMNKFKQVFDSFEENFTGVKKVETSSEDVYIPPEDESYDLSEDKKEPGMLDDLDEFIRTIRMVIEARGYKDKIDVERVDEYVYFRFADDLLFKPDLAILRPTSYDSLNFIGGVLTDAYSEISSIEIAGHTSWVPIDEIQTNFASWKLSSERALTVLKFLVTECDLSKEKMTILGYSSTQPYLEGETEEEKAKNRRVEIRIKRLIDED